MPVLATNKRAYFDYEILEKFEAGLVLLGHEVKATKAGHASLKGSYIKINWQDHKAELYLVNAHISLYKLAGNVLDYDPKRERKLLLNRSEINRLIGKTQEQGLTLLPLKIYTKHSFLKLEFALARGKKKYDKREAIKKRELDRRLRTLTKRV